MTNQDIIEFKEAHGVDWLTLTRMVAQCQRVYSHDQHRDMADAIIAAAPGVFGLPWDELMIRDRHRNIVATRWAIYLALERYAGLSAAAIAKLTGYDRTTIVHALDMARQEEASSHEFAQAVIDLYLATTTQSNS